MNDESDGDTKTIAGESTKASEFESTKSVLRYKFNINENIIDKYVDIISKNESHNDVDDNQSNSIIRRKNQIHL